MKKTILVSISIIAMLVTLALLIFIPERLPSPYHQVNLTYRRPVAHHRDPEIQAQSEIPGVHKEPHYLAKEPIHINAKIAIYQDQNSVLHNKQLEVNSSQNIQPVKPPEIKKYLVKQARMKCPITGYVEGGGLYGYLTSGYGIWSNQYLRGFAHIDNKNSVGLLASNNYEYKEHADYIALDQVHVFNEDWYINLSVGTSNKSIYLPNYSIGGKVFRKLKANRTLVTYLGVHAYRWRPIYSTQDINPGFIYYFQKPWIVELGTYINRSNPGGIYSASVYTVVTQGRDKNHYLTLRLGIGKEAYLPVGIGIPAAVGYFSAVITGTWRQWWGRDWGTNIVVENYNNPFYKRYGAAVGVFKEFSI